MNQDPTTETKPPGMPSAPPPQMPMAPMVPIQQTTPPAQMDPYAVSQDDRTMGMLVHLLALLTGLLGTLILWLVKKDESRFVDHHGKEAINFQLTVLLYVFCLMVFGIVTMGFGFFVAFPLMMVLGIGAFVFELMACLAANRGEWHRYPMTIRFIK